MAGHVSYMVERSGAYRRLVGKPEKKTQHVSHTLGREDNIKMDLQKIGLAGWIGSVWLRKGRCGRRL
jgi:hypothetical protein